MLTLLLLTLAAPAADWTRLRGPNGSGVAEGASLPNELSSTTKNLIWKAQIPTGKSSPAVTADRIYLTGHENNKLQTFALDRKSGRILWKIEAPGHRDEKRNKLNDPASPSPVADSAKLAATSTPTPATRASVADDVFDLMADLGVM